MPLLGKRDAPVAFAPDPFDPHGARPLTRVDGAGRDALRAQVKEYCPQTPGVYGMLSDDGELLYVGKSKHLRERLLSYFRAEGRDKAAKLMRHTRAILWEPAPSEFAALLREQALIRAWQPAWNVQGKPHRDHPVYLCLGRSPKCLYVAREPAKNAAWCDGPFFSSRLAGRSVELLNRFFRLRDCPNTQRFLFADQLELFPGEKRAGCLRLELGTCLGPCAGGCSRGEYERQALEAKRFLEGGHAEPLEHHERLMAALAAEQKYEQAARARDDRDALAWLQDRLKYLQRVRETYTFVYPVRAADRPIWYLVRRGQIEGAVALPRCPATRATAAEAITNWLAAPAPLLAAGMCEPTRAIVIGWFQRQAEELATALPPALALEQCQAARQPRRRAKAAV